MITCSNCGRTNNDTAKFCIYCGQPVMQPAVKPAAIRRAGTDATCIARELKEAGWKDIVPGNYLGFNFDFVGSRKAIGVVQWNVLVRFLPVLDSETANVCAADFQQMNKKAQSWVMGKCFILCLVAQEIDPAILGSLQGSDFGLFGIIRMKGGGGTILVSDEKSGQVFGDIPRLPRDVHNFMTVTMKALMRCVDSGVTARGTHHD